MKPIRIESVFLPREIAYKHNPVCVLVDAIRASCTVVTLLEKGFDEILLTDDERRSIERYPAIQEEHFCICAEKVEGTRADLADVSPSLVELQDFPDSQGGKVLFRTTNGTEGVRAINALGIQEIYIGCMLNCDAVAAAVVERARMMETGICVVGAGRENGQIYCIDDTYCCAVLIESMEKYAQRKEYATQLQDSTKIALSMSKDYSCAEEAFARSATGEIMRLARTEEDILLCAQKNISHLVPKVCGEDAYGHIRIAEIRDQQGDEEIGK